MGINSSGTVVPQVLTPAWFTSSLYLPWKSAGRFPLAVCNLCFKIGY